MPVKSRQKPGFAIKTSVSFEERVKRQNVASDFSSLIFFGSTGRSGNRSFDKCRPQHLALWKSEIIPGVILIAILITSKYQLEFKWRTLCRESVNLHRTGRCLGVCDWQTDSWLIKRHNRKKRYTAVTYPGRLSFVDVTSLFA